MKTLIMLLSACLLQFQLLSQNVGIGTMTPAEKLDVNGNVNITGALKANGIAGQPGQVLMSTGNGISWGSTMEYKNFKVFTANGSFTVPPNVTEVMVELWGAGSGGTQLIGGTSGGYARTKQPVTPGTVLNITIGGGSAGGVGNTTTDAGSSYVEFPLGFVEAKGGGGITTSGGFYKYGQPKSGEIDAALSQENTILIFGNCGTVYNETGTVHTSAITTWIQHYGTGGPAVGFFNSEPSKGASIIIYQNSGTFNSNSIDPPPQNGLPYSRGGSFGFADFSKGGDGLVIVWWN